MLIVIKCPPGNLKHFEVFICNMPIMLGYNNDDDTWTSVLGEDTDEVLSYEIEEDKFQDRLDDAGNKVGEIYVITDEETNDLF